MSAGKRPPDAPPAQPALDPLHAAQEELRRAGASLGSHYDTRHTIFVPGAANAQRVARELYRDDREIQVDNSSRKGYWLLVVTLPALITPEGIALVRAELEQTVLPYGGVYGTWSLGPSGAD